LKRRPRYLYPPGGEPWTAFAGRVVNAHALAIFLDYDGTLTPIRKKPEQARLSVNALKTLQTMRRLPGVDVAVVTGRSMPDIRARIPLRGITIAANHGLQIKRDGSVWVHPGTKVRRMALLRVTRAIKRFIPFYPGVQFESKGFTLSIHYRNAAPGVAGRLKRSVTDAVSAEGPLFRLAEGKKVIEVRPSLRWGKGDAVMKILREGRRNRLILPLYFGDDRTDEDAFRALSSRGITIRVGADGSTEARYYVRNTGAVVKILKFIISVRKGFDSTTSQSIAGDYNARTRRVQDIRRR
jgi:trehalose 6-phosphate phosphatase